MSAEPKLVQRGEGCAVDCYQQKYQKRTVEKMDLAKFDITYPGQLTLGQQKAVFDAFEKAYPNEVCKWKEAELSGSNDSDIQFREISRLFRSFIFDNTNCNSQMATSSLFMDMRKIIHGKV